MWWQLPWIFFRSLLIKFSGQLCPVHWNNHHPGAETAVSWHWWERIQHLPVSYSHPVQLCQCATYRNTAYRDVNHDDRRISNAICSMEKSDWLFPREQSRQYSTFFLLSIESCVFQNLKRFDLTPTRFVKVWFVPLLPHSSVASSSFLSKTHINNIN